MHKLQHYHHQLVRSWLFIHTEPPDLLFLPHDLMNYSFIFAGLITTTSRRLDREQQAEHILEVNYVLDCLHLHISHASFSKYVSFIIWFPNIHLRGCSSRKETVPMLQMLICRKISCYKC